MSEKTDRTDRQRGLNEAEILCDRLWMDTIDQTDEARRFALGFEVAHALRDIEKGFAEAAQARWGDANRPDSRTTWAAALMALESEMPQIVAKAAKWGVLDTLGAEIARLAKTDDSAEEAT